MAEFIMGTGQQTSARKIIGLLEHQLIRTEGQPRRIIARTQVMEIQADRDELEGEFDQYRIRVKPGAEQQQALQSAVAESNGYCTLTEEDSWTVLTCPAEGSPSTPERR